MLREMRSLNRADSRGEERTDVLIQFLLDLIHRERARSMKGFDKPELLPPARRGPRTPNFLLDMAAAQGVNVVQFTVGPRGAADVRVDGGRLFRLSRTLTFLLQGLLQQGGAHDGNLIGWKSRSEIQLFLEECLHKSLSRRSIEQLIYRLRKELKSQAGLNPRLVMTHPRLGWRFALRRHPIVSEPDDL